MDCTRTYIDNITLVAIVYWFFKLRTSADAHEEIWYFDGISSWAKWCLKILTVSGASIKIKQVDYCWGHLRSDDGNAVWHEVANHDLRLICDRVRERELGCSGFLRKLGMQHLDYKRLLLYIEKRIHAEMMEQVIRINVISNFLKEEQSGSQRICCLLGNNKWSAYLREYGIEKNVEIVFYPCLTSGLGSDLFQPAYFSLTRFPRVFLNTMFGICRVGRSEEVCSRRTPLSISYSNFSINGDRSRRHDLFWWLGTAINPTDVLIYCTRRDLPLSKKETQFIEGMGMRFIAMYPGAVDSPDAPLWRSTWKFYQMGLKLWASILWAFMGSLLRERGRVGVYVQYISALVFDFSFWFDFFKTQGIKVNINYSEFVSFYGIGCTMALRQLDGINVSYQGSNLYDASIDITPASDVLFSYSPIFVDLWQHYRLSTENIIATGYIFDSNFCEVVEQSKLARKKLEARGAQFVIAYFDENSSPSRNAIITNQDTASIYAELLRMLLADATLGLVCKPKKVRDLFKRIAGIEPLLEEAMATGRLLIIDDRTTFPAEAGLMADIAIGDLVGTTAALEAYLAGVPSVLVDAMDMKKHPYYAWGRGTVVFENWSDFFATLEQYRENPDLVPDFGNWEPIVDQLDPFRDGRASFRMGQYMTSLLHSLREGKGSALAIQHANEQYEAEWGHGIIG